MKVLVFLSACSGKGDGPHQLPGSEDVVYQEATVKPGSFLLGASETDKTAFAVEKPSSKVSLSHAMAMGRSEITQGLWSQITGYNPSKYKRCGANCPVETVNFCDALLFANALSKVKGLKPVYDLPKEMTFRSQRLQCNAWVKAVQVLWDNDGYRLPTEAEWEYSAKAGGVGVYSGGDNLAEINASVVQDSDSSSHPVGQTVANSWGIHGMSGNVWEWVWDPYRDYTSTPKTNPNGGSSTGYRSFRGGGWSNADNYTRINCDYCRRNTHRGSVDPGFSGGMLGFRLVRRIPRG